MSGAEQLGRIGSSEVVQANVSGNMQANVSRSSRTNAGGAARANAGGAACAGAGKTTRANADEAAQRYLNENSELRRALEIRDGVELQAQPLGRGEHNDNYLFSDSDTGRAFVLRVNVEPQPFHDNQVAYEFAALKLLQPSGRVPEALYLDDSREAPGKGALVIGFCEGDELDFDALRPGDLRCAAQIMADVHAVPVPAPAECALFRPADPLHALFEECLDRFGFYRKSTFEDPRITRWVERFIKAAQQTLNKQALNAPRNPADCAHVINTEPLPSHFLIVADSGRGSFVDWERPIIGEVAQDVAYFTAPTTTFWDSDYLFSPDEAEQFAEDYWHAVDGRFERGSFDARFRAYRMMTALRSTTWCCKALVRYAAESDGRKIPKTQEKLPSYLSDDFLEMLARDCFGL